MAQEGKLLLAGPFEGGEGIFVLNAASVGGGTGLGRGGSSSESSAVRLYGTQMVYRKSNADFRG